MPCDSHNLKEECASSLVEAFSLPSNAERLARKPAADDVVVGEVGSRDSCKVASVNSFSLVIIIINVTRILVVLICKDYAVAGSL